MTKVTSFDENGSLLNTVEYEYDILDRRVAKSFDYTNGIVSKRTFFTLDGDHVAISEQFDDVAVNDYEVTKSTFLWEAGVDQLLSIDETGDDYNNIPSTPVHFNTLWTASDHQGTVRDYFGRKTGTSKSYLLASHAGDAYGFPDAIEQWGTVVDDDFHLNSIPPFFYVGQSYDAETGLQYSRARYYDPYSREFISEDPLGFAAGDTNLYRRVGNSPLNATDPSGKIANVAIGGLIGAVFGGGAYYLQTVISGEEFEWNKFGVAVGAGAVSGAIAGATLGASLLVQGAATGAAYGGITGFGNTYIDTGGDVGASLQNGAIDGTIGGVAGAAGGAIGGRVFSGLSSRLGGSSSLLGRAATQHIIAGVADGGVEGAISGTVQGARETGTFAGAFSGGAQGLATGSLTAGLSNGGGAILRRLGSAFGRGARRQISISPQRRVHILDGDRTGGGHRPGLGKPGKSEFPQGMTDDQIIGTITDVARDPTSLTVPGRGGRTIIEGTRNGIDIRVVIESDGSIVSGFPTNVPRNSRR